MMVQEVYNDELQIQRLMSQNGKSPNLQHFCMGSFLIELLVQIAALRCSDSDGVVYLRACTSFEAFYRKHGSGDATWLGDDLIKNIPSVIMQLTTIP